MKTFRSLLVVLVSAAAMLAGCADKCSIEAKKIIEKDNGRLVELTVGNSLIVELPGNPSTGYTWELDSTDQKIIQQAVSYTPFKSDSNVIGAPGKMTLRFKAVGPGKTDLKLAYHRVWEKGVAPARTYEIKVEVK